MSALRGPGALARSRAAVVGGTLVLTLTALAAFGPALAGHAPEASDFTLGRGAAGGPAPPSAAHWLGTDALFRDQLARLTQGARASLAIGVGASFLAVCIGAVVGTLAGWFAGRGVGWGRWRVGPDDVLMRLADAVLGFPFLLLVLAVGASIERTTQATILLVLGLTGWPGVARLVRAKVLTVRELDFVVAARALGARELRLLLAHVAPAVTGLAVVLGTLSVGQMIVAEAVLGYLGVGVPPPAATWGRMLHEGQDLMESAPWIAAAPALAIVAAVLGFNLLGEGLRAFLDPEGR